MTTEIGTTEAVTSDDLSAAKLAFIEAVRSGQAGAPLLHAILGNTKLSPEQRAFVDMLTELESAKSGAEEPQESEPPLDDIKQELADLREANDTMASALGACPYCWGGDRHCEVCRGRGRPGYRRPDPELFNELVMPAIQRVRELNQSRIGFRGGRVKV